MRYAVALLACTGCLSEPPRNDCRAPRPLVELNTGADETGPWLSPDRLEMLFTSGDRTGVATVLLHASRTRPDVDFDDVVVASGLEGLGGGVRDGFIEADGLTLWFTVFDSAGSSERLFRATRAKTLSARFDAPEPVASIGAGGHPSLTADRLTLFFHRRTTADNQAVFRTNRDAPDLPFAPALPLPQLAPSGLGVVMAPSISGVGDRLLYTVGVSPTQLQIYEADLIGVDFDPGSLEEDVERGDHNDRDGALHVEGESIVFASDRDGNYDLFVACE